VTGRFKGVASCAALLLTACLVTACSGSGKHAESPPLSTLRARAVLTSEHPVNGKEQIFHGPLVGYSVAAVGVRGNRVTAAIDKSGLAVLRLPAGRYVVTTSDRDACPPARVTLASAEVLTVDLRCVTP
jgi:hypothetical protein